MKKKLRVAVLMHEDRVPPDDDKGVDPAVLYRCKTERGVVESLRRAGHEVCKLGLRAELTPLRNALQEWQPDIVFNMLEEFDSMVDEAVDRRASDIHVEPEGDRVRIRFRIDGRMLEARLWVLGGVFASVVLVGGGLLAAWWQGFGDGTGQPFALLFWYASLATTCF
ncbi:MAG: hypothetical protein IIA33_09310, partial [Planctomycetes bacterium]|nr:hypothetical protein [Planctomycetota bacterium]